MDRQTLAALRSWFDNYCRSFCMESIEDRRNLKLKEDHTQKVCENIAGLAGALSLDERRTCLAEAIGLLHDVGRFRQYAQYRTFRDSISVNHALLGIEIIKSKSVLDSLEPEEQRVILEAIKYHNAFSLPDLAGEALLLAKLIRDADKLDIWRVFLEYYEEPQEQRASAAGLGLPDLPEYSPEILGRIMKGQVALLATLRTVNDFKLMQLSWVYDLNFPASFRLLAERGYVEKLGQTLPQTAEIREALASIGEYIKSRLSLATQQAGAT